MNEICLKRWRSYIGTRNTPFAQRLNIGWVLFGDICLGNFRKPTTVASFKTTLVDSHRETIFRPCRDISMNHLQANVFHVQVDDNKTGLSTDDKEFMGLMKSFQKDQDRRLKASLPFRNPRQFIPHKPRSSI